MSTEKPSNEEQSKPSLLGDVSTSTEDYTKALQHYHDSSVGLWCLDRNPKKLLTEFWNRESDACPLEASLSEKQELEFSQWVETISFQLKSINKYDCIVLYDGRECNANVISKNETTFDVITSFGEKMYNIPLSKFRAE